MQRLIGGDEELFSIVTLPLSYIVTDVSALVYDFVVYMIVNDLYWARNVAEVLALVARMWCPAQIYFSDVYYAVFQKSCGAKL